MSMTNYLEDKLLDHAFGGTAYAQPTSFTIGLFTADPGETGSTANEVSTTGTGYARQTVTFNAASGGAKTNSALIEFPQATASWGTITHAAIFDELGNMLAYGQLVDPNDMVTPMSKTINSGDILRFDAGKFKVTLD